MSHRLAQVASLLRRSVSEVLQRGLADPRISGLTSITRIEVTPDMSQAFIYISVLPEEHGATSVAGLNHAARHIHDLVRQKVTLKHVPKLIFRLDEMLKKQAEVLAAIREAEERTGVEAMRASDGDEQSQPGYEPNTPLPEDQP
ncbi:MAG: 30S ribosome-binding factor RbfA [Phycisphaeraceae bacterium]